MSLTTGIEATEHVPNIFGTVSGRPGTLVFCEPCETKYLVIPGTIPEANSSARSEKARVAGSEGEPFLCFAGTEMDRVRRIPDFKITRLIRGTGFPTPKHFQKTHQFPYMTKV